MKLKFINLLLASGLLVGSAQVFTSCKDNEADLYVEQKAELISLQQDLKNKYVTKTQLADDLKAAKDELKGKISADSALLESKIKANDDKIQGLIDQLTGEEGALSLIEASIEVLQGELNSQVGALTEKIDSVGGQVDDLGVQITEINTQLAEVKELLANLPADLTDRVVALESYQDELKTTILPEIAQKATEAKAQAEANAIAIEAANNTITNLNNLVERYQTENTQAISAVKESIRTLQGKVDSLEEEVNALKDDIEDKFQRAIGYTLYMVSGLRGYVEDSLLVVNERISANAENIAANTEAIEALKDEIAGVHDEINQVSSRIDYLIRGIQDLKNAVTSITLEGTDNPIIGYFSTPLGVESNILMNFCGSNPGAAINFPSTDEGIEFNNPEEHPLTPAELAYIENVSGYNSTVVPSGARLCDGNLGTIYFSVNPVNIDLEGKEFTLTNTLGKKSVVTLQNVKACNDVKKFGYSRKVAQSPNGWYQADVVLAEGSSLEGVQIEINEGLKTAVKNVYENRNAASLVSLGKALYHQIDGILPALAINCSWATEDGKQAVNSNYGIAATVFQPLSYTTLYGKSFRQIHLPDFGDYEFKLNTSGINVDLGDIMFDVDFEDIELGINLQLSCQISDLGTLDVVAVVEGVPDGGYVNEDGEVVFDKYKDITVKTDVSLKDLEDKLNEQLKGQFDNMNAEINNKINAAFENAIQEIRRRITQGVNDMLESVQVKIDDTLVDVVQNLQDQVNDYIGKFVDKVENSRYYDAVEKIVNKLNKITADPNHYMQPTLLYSASGKYGIVSSVKDAPSVFVLNSGDAATLVPTTYNAEIVTPAYLKYIAVANVYKYGDETVSARNGDAKALELLKAANAQKYMNVPVSGQRTAFPLKLTGAKGYVFEIVYQALDFHGRTATNKYYVRVK